MYKFLMIILWNCIVCMPIYAQQKSRPNIIIILADDLGYGDLSINGGDVPVPALEKLAREGMRFTDFHTNGAVCSPTRAALLTGRYQQRMGIEKALTEKDDGLGDAKAKKEVTLAKYLQQAGYYTGVLGKWHLGSSAGQNPVNYGFGEFKGVLHGSNDYFSKVTTMGTYDWWENNMLVQTSEYNTELITKHAVSFLQANKDRPFFLYVAQNAIHFPWQKPGDTAFRKEGLKYNQVHGPLNKLGQHPPGEVRKVVQAMITEMDKSIGRIMETVRELKLDKNTLVLFCSDNGGIVAYEGGYQSISSNQPYRGEKGNLYEGGHRVPAVAWWPGHIKAGMVNKETIMTMDILPTILEITGIQKNKIMNEPDGKSVAAQLFSNKKMVNRKLFWKHRDLYAVRFGEWKLVQNNKMPVELYNLEKDPGEMNNVADSNRQRVKELQADLAAWKENIYANN
jgi:arylsulfatase A